MPLLLGPLFWNQQSITIKLGTLRTIWCEPTGRCCMTRTLSELVRGGREHLHAGKPQAPDCAQAADRAQGVLLVSSRGSESWAVLLDLGGHLKKTFGPLGDMGPNGLYWGARPSTH